MPESEAMSVPAAARHGLYSDLAVASVYESAGEWNAFHDAILDSLRPEGPLEPSLASRVAALCWRLRRVPVAEAQAIQRRLDDERALKRETEKMLESPSPGVRCSAPAARPVGNSPDPASFERIARTEAHLHRQLVQTLHELEALQARRRGERVPLDGSMSTASRGQEKGTR